MPHLSFEYSAGLEAKVDLNAFADAMRDAIMATGEFPLGGTRVRGYRADVCVLADGGEHDFLDIIFRIGSGRTDETKKTVVEALYAAAEEFLRPSLGGSSFALSFELLEMNAAFSVKRFNTVRDHL
ncbi:MAG: 5-carboxymethyl-2-hydroxymuconate isomerase [Pikeienuella sp.]